MVKEKNIKDNQDKKIVYSLTNKYYDGASSAYCCVRPGAQPPLNLLPVSLGLA